MRNELNEIDLIDRYLFRQLTEEEARAFETGLLLDEAFAEKVEAQRMTHRLIHRYARQQDRSWFEHIYRQLRNEPAFTQKIKTIFA